jgi:phospholipid/cholesterol/gamma-HCH transport system permease protein
VPATVAHATAFPGRILAQLLYALEYMGGVIQLGLHTFRAVVKPPYDFNAILDQIQRIGIDSMSVATLTAVFSSMVMTVQFAVQLARFGAKDYVSAVVSISLVRELGPVLAALMVGGRVGAGIAAELGSMTVTEQVDAIRSMGADPVKKLVVPRVVAAIIVLPLLTAFADALGIIGGMVVAQVAEGVNMTYFFNSLITQVTVADVTGGLTKTLFFGLWISLIACYQGLATTNGTEGVGESTTRTVVITSVVTLVGDFVLTSILLSFGL